MQPASALMHFSYGGHSWIKEGYSSTWYNHVATPNSDVPDCSIDPPTYIFVTNGGNFAARSNHPGGVNALLMDGSVRFMSDSVSLQIWRALGTRAANDSVNGLQL